MSKKQTTHNNRNNDAPNLDQEIIQEMKRMMAATGNERLSEAQKNLLLKDVFGAVKQRHVTMRRRYERIIGIAASVLIVLSAMVYLSGRKNNYLSEMQKIAGRSVLNKVNNAMVLLNNGKSVSINDQHSIITYRGSQKLQIGQKIINQAVTAENNNYNTLLVPYGRRASLILDDGTKVWVNSGSKLVYPATFFNNNRQVYLEGEAYFEVKHDEHHPFKVLTNNSEIEDIGTEFNVSAYPDDKEVATVLAKGSVLFTANSNSMFNKVKKELTPDDRIVWRLADNGVTVKRVNTEEYTSWKEGYLIVNNQPLLQILKKLERFYKIQITLKDDVLINQTFSGRLDLQDDVYKTLSNICTTTNLTYETGKGGMILKNNY